MQQLFGQFQTIPSIPIIGLTVQANFQDQIPGASGGWSNGGQIITAIPATPSLNESWTIFGWGMSLQGWYAYPGGTGQSYGQIGKLIGAMIFGGSIPTTQPVPITSFTPFSPLPLTALTSAQVLWDGSQDPPFPWLTLATASQNQGNVQRSFNLNSPQHIDAGDQFGIGMWLTPSLGQNVKLVVLNASYTVLYDVQAPGAS